MDIRIVITSHSGSQSLLWNTKSCCALLSYFEIMIIKLVSYVVYIYISKSFLSPCQKKASMFLDTFDQLRWTSQKGLTMKDPLSGLYSIKGSFSLHPCACSCACSCACILCVYVRVLLVGRIRTRAIPEVAMIQDRKVNINFDSSELCTV